ncbi:BPI fold-containing family B member 4-like isoform X2 [Struthio camelus]|uniref:BPI fold-containing family B member 4-like isoform X2 n=1 Tax=Struthio camelus TaxID=8801 RepID=UPI0036041569
MLSCCCLAILWGLLPPSQGLLNLGSALGLSPARPGDGGLLGAGILSSEGLLGGKGGVLGTGFLSEGGLLGTGLLGKEGPSGKGSKGLPGAGNESSRTGLLGSGLLGGQPGNNGLIGTGVLGGEGLLGNGLLGNGLLGNKGLLGEEGLLGTGLLGKAGLLGNGSLLGLDGLLGEGGLLGGGVPQKSTQGFAWLKVLNLEDIRASWKVLHGSELVLNLYSKLTLNLPGIFLFLSGSSVETNITSHIALTQDTPGDLKLVIKDCGSLFGGFKINLRKGLFTNIVGGLVNSSLRSFLPALFCPLVNIWFGIINIQLQFLDRVVSFGLLGKIHSALSNVPVTTGQFVELDLQNSPFPSTFLDWLLQTAGVHPGSSVQ